MMKVVKLVLGIILLLFGGDVGAQNGKPVIIPTDSTTQTKNPDFTKDTGVVVKNNDTKKADPKHNPAKATRRSIIIPGLGQAYNREYWKIPIVYGALGTIAGIYIYNNTWYKRSKEAYEIRVTNDTANFDLIHPRLQTYPTNSLVILRNTFRKDRDYAALWFVIAWGLNIVDATVFGHLKEFDVSEDISLKINPSINQNSKGFSLVFAYKPAIKHRQLVF
jgi:hypothetical protein